MDVLDHNRVLLAELLDKHLPAAHYTPPQASFLAWIDFRDLGWGDGGGGGVLLRSVQVAAVAEASADPAQSGQQFTDDERETVRRQIGRVRAAADWLEGALDNGEFTLDEQLVQLLMGE